MSRENTRFRICTAIQRIRMDAGATARQITERTTLAISTVRKHLAELRTDGVVEAFENPRLGYTYRVKSMPAKPRKKARKQRSRLGPPAPHGDNLGLNTVPGTKARILVESVEDSVQAQREQDGTPITAEQGEAIRVAMATVDNAAKIVATLVEPKGIHEIGAALRLRRNDLQRALHGLTEAGALLKERSGKRWVYRVAV